MRKALKVIIGVFIYYLPRIRAIAIVYIISKINWSNLNPQFRRTAGLQGPHQPDVAGTTRYDYESMVMSDGIEGLADDALSTIAAGALTEAGFSMKDVVRARHYITDRGNVATVFQMLGKVFGDIGPAATDGDLRSAYAGDENRDRSDGEAVGLERGRFSSQLAVVLGEPGESRIVGGLSLSF